MNELELLTELDALEESEGLEELEESEGLEESEELKEKVPKRRRRSLDNYLPGKISIDMYDYCIQNYERVMGWIKRNSYSSAARNKSQTLSAHTIFDMEDIIQETYFRILKTFFDNKQRLQKCSACTHQCEEFLKKTKVRNTEKKAKGQDCRPYMFYKYSEKEFHNYINHAFKLNMDIKLLRINEKGKRKVVHMEESLGNGEDACELGSLIADMSSSLDKTDLEKFLNKKLLFKTPIPELYAMTTKEHIELEEEAYVYNPKHEEDPTEPELILATLTKPWKDILEEYEYLWSDEMIEEDAEAFAQAALDAQSELSPVCEDAFPAKMTYDRTTEVSFITEREERSFIPAPYYTYAIMTVRDFLEAAESAKFKEEVDFDAAQSLNFMTEYQSSWKEVYADLSSGYSVVENLEYSDPLTRKNSARASISLALRDYNHSELKEVLEELKEDVIKTIKPEFEDAFIKKTIKFLEAHIKDSEVSDYVQHHYVDIKVRHVGKYTPQERKILALQKYKALEKQEFPENIEEVDTEMLSKELENLTNKKLFNKCLKEAPIQKTYYVKERTKVLCPLSRIQQGTQSILV